MVWHLGKIWDTVAAAIPDSVAIVHGDVRIDWRSYENRAARLASAIKSIVGDTAPKVAILAYNSPAWLEAQYAAFKLGGLAINVNYRYRGEELQYLLDSSDADVLFYETEFAPTLADLQPGLGKIRLWGEIAASGASAQSEGADTFETILAAHPPLREPRYSDEDLHVIYTGGTTGSPKGVLFRQAEFARMMLMGYSMRGLETPKTYEELAAEVQRIEAEGSAPVSIPAAPLMHSTAMTMGVMMPHALGGKAVTFDNRHFDPDTLWSLVAAERVTEITIVGDAFAKPMVASLERAQDEGRPYDLSTLKQISSSGVMFTVESKEALLRHADVSIIDSVGASEGAMARSTASRANPPSNTGSFRLNLGTKLFDQDDQEILPGSKQVGRIATSSMVPVGYYGDAAKSEATFRTIGGVRYSFPGDYGRYSADGTIIFLGRGSNCINTGGEKVFPEEVEEAVKLHPDVTDCLVVGAVDDRFGQRVVAIASRASGNVSAAELTEFVKTRLAGYKAPREVIFVAEVRRGPNGKADYAWARDQIPEAVR